MPGEEPWRAHTFSTGAHSLSETSWWESSGRAGRGAWEPGCLRLSLPILRSPTPPPSWPLRRSELLEQNPWHSRGLNHLVASGILEPRPVNKCLSQLGPYREAARFTPETRSGKTATFLTSAALPRRSPVRALAPVPTSLFGFSD